MQTQSTSDHKAARVLTQNELNQVSGGAVAEASGRTFNPQPDPPGAMQNPPADGWVVNELSSLPYTSKGGRRARPTADAYARA